MQILNIGYSYSFSNLNFCILQLAVIEVTVIPIASYNYEKEESQSTMQEKSMSSILYIVHLSASYCFKWESLFNCQCGY